jgi:hypothetical protein
MPDNLKRRQPEDPKRINIHEAWELEHWSSSLGVTKTKLTQAVKAVGPMVTDVKAWLAKH